MSRRRRSGGLAAAALAIAAALSFATGFAGGGPPALTVPAVDGPLDLRVVAPAAGTPAPASRRAYVIGSTGSGRARLSINGADVRVLPNGAFLAYLPSPPADDAVYRLLATLDGRTVTRTIPLAPASRRGGAAAPASGAAGAEPRWAVLARGGAPTRSVAARPVPGGTYRWFLLPGTRVQVAGESAGQAHIRLGPGLDAWVDRRDVQPLARDVPPPARVTGDVEVRAGAEWTDVSIAVAEPPPFLVREAGSTVTLTLYGTRGNTNRVRYPSGEGWLRSVAWEPGAEEQVEYTARLAGPAYGYRVFWRDGLLVLQLRHPPAANRWRSPLHGRVVAVDAGHPPAGAVGPTGLREAGATLAVARRLDRILRARGARVVLTRADSGPVELNARAARAESAGAHALVSIHLDATPPNVDPRAVAGTATHFFHPHSEALARAVQAGMVRRLGLPDQGVAASNLAMTRPTWMPAVLCEGATLVVPEHEAAFRTAEFQEAYARGIADGLEAFFTDPSSR